MTLIESIEHGLANKYTPDFGADDLAEILAALKRMSPEAAKLPNEDDIFWAFQYDDGSWWTDDIFSTKNSAEKFAKGPDADLVEGAELVECQISRVRVPQARTDAEQQ